MATEVNQHDIINEIAIRYNIKRGTARAIYNDTINLIRRYLRDGHDVVLNGFAKLEHVERAARTARNPATGETVQVPAKTVVRVRNRKGLNDFNDVYDLPYPETQEQRDALTELYEKWINPKLHG